MSNSSFRSSDSVRSDSSTMSKNQSNPNRKVPIIHPSKLKNPIFGNTAKMFKTPKTAQQHHRQQPIQPKPVHLRMGTGNQNMARATDTNRTVALQRLQVELRNAINCPNDFISECFLSLNFLEN